MSHHDDASTDRPEGGVPPAEERVCVRLALGGVTVAFAGRRAFFQRHVEPLVEAMYARAPEAPSAAGPEGEVFRPSEPQRFQQFSVQIGANAESLEQRVMAFAFYLWNYERRDTFDAETLASFFRTVQQEPPDDLASLLADLADGKRWLERGDAPETWRLTTKGVNYVKNRLLGA